MDRLQTLEMFVAVADRGGFAAAAKAQNMSPPTVTRAISALEGRLGVSLFHRSTRAVALTDDGASFLPRARQILADIQDAERRVSGAQSEPRGQFYVTAPVMFGRLHVLPVIATMLEQYAQLDVRHQTIGTTGPRAMGEWRLDDKRVKTEPRLLLNTMDATVAAAEAGLGIANLLSYQVEEPIRQGKLIEVLEPVDPQLLPVNLLFESARRSLPATRIFIDAMKDRAMDQGLTRLGGA